MGSCGFEDNWIPPPQGGWVASWFICKYHGFGRSLCFGYYLAVPVRYGPWRWFMENLVQYATLAPEEFHAEIINKGAHWSGAGYGQGNLSRLIHDFTKVGLLAISFDVYWDGVLVGLALFWRINSIPKAPAGDAMDAVWALCDALTKHSLGENEDPEDFPLPWVEQPFELSPLLAHM